MLHCLKLHTYRHDKDMYLLIVRLDRGDCNISLDTIWMMNVERAIGAIHAPISMFSLS